MREPAQRCTRLRFSQPYGRTVKHEIVERRTFPSSQRRGGCAERSEAQTGWSDRPRRFAELTTPARQLLLSCRATPPLRGGEFCSSLSRWLASWLTITPRTLKIPNAQSGTVSTTTPRPSGVRRSTSRHARIVTGG